MNNSREKKFPVNSSLKLAKQIAGYAADVKAEEITILDMSSIVNFCDFFVISTGNSTRQVRAVADHIEEKMNEQGITLRYKQGLREGRWAIIDLGTVVAHIFEKETRSFYRLDYLWQDANKIDWET